MRAKKILKSKGFLISVGVTILFLGIVSFLLLSGKEKTRPQSFPNISSVPNPSPLNPAKSPNVDKAQKEEIDWLKKHGKYFDWGKDALMGDRQEKPKVPETKVVTVRPASNTDAEKQMLWETFWKSFPPDKAKGGTLSLAMAGDAGESRGRQGPSFEYRAGCPFKATVLRSSYATLKSETPLLMKVTDPANCAGLPVGTVVVASMKADYSSFRANVQVHSLSLPGGSNVPAKGFVMGPDGLPGVGHKVVRNDRKTLGLASLFEGIGAGFKAAREDSTETTCYEWGCEQKETKSDNRLQEGIVEGVGTFMGGVADGIVGEYRQVSPIVVTVPQGFPVEIVLEG